MEVTKEPMDLRMVRAERGIYDLRKIMHAHATQLSYLAQEVKRLTEAVEDFRYRVWNHGHLFHPGIEDDTWETDPKPIIHDKIDCTPPPRYT